MDLEQPQVNDMDNEKSDFLFGGFLALLIIAALIADLTLN